MGEGGEGPGMKDVYPYGDWDPKAKNAPEGPEVPNDDEGPEETAFHEAISDTEEAVSSGGVGDEDVELDAPEAAPVVSEGDEARADEPQRAIVEGGNVVQEEEAQGEERALMRTIGQVRRAAVARFEKFREQYPNLRDLEGFLRHDLERHMRFIEADAPPVVLQGSSAVLATLIEKDILPDIDVMAKTGLLALFARTRVPNKLAVPLSSFLGDLLARKIEDAAVDIEREIKDKLVDLLDDDNDVLRYIKTVSQAFIEKRAELTAAEGAEEEADGDEDPETPVPDPVPAPAVATPAVVADPDLAAALGGGEVDDPDEDETELEDLDIDLEAGGGGIEEILGLGTIEEEPDPGDGEWREGFFMDKSDVTTEVLTMARRVESRFSGIPLADRPVYTEEDLLRVAKVLYAREKGRRDWEVRTIEVGGVPRHYLEFDVRRKEQVDQFRVAGGGAESIVATLAADNKLAYYTEAEMYILRSLDTRRYEPRAETLFEELMLERVRERIEEEGGDAVTQERRDDIVQEVYEEYRDTLYKLNYWLLQKLRLPPEEGGADKQETERSVFSTMESQLALLEKRIFESGFSDEDRRIACGDATFKVTTIVSTLAKMPDPENTDPDRPIAGERSVRVYGESPEKVTFNYALAGEIAPDLEEIDNVIQILNSGKEAVYSGADIEQLVKIAGKLKSKEVVTALRASEFDVYAMQAYMPNLDNAIQAADRLPMEDFLAISDVDGLNDAVRATILDLYSHFGPREDQLDEAGIEEKVNERLNVAAVEVRVADIEDADERAARRDQLIEEQKTDHRRDIVADEKKRDKRFWDELKAAAWRAEAYHQFYTGEFWDAIISAFEEGLTSSKVKSEEVDQPDGTVAIERTHTQTKPYNNPESAIMNHAIKLIAFTPERYGMQVGEGAVGIPINRTSGAENLNQFSHFDFGRFTAMQRDARRNGATDELLDLREKCLFLPELLDKKNGLLRAGGWVVSPLDMLHVNEYVREGKAEAEAMYPDAESPEAKQHVHEHALDRMYRFAGVRGSIHYIDTKLDDMMADIAVEGTDWQATAVEFKNAKQAVTEAYGKAPIIDPRIEKRYEEAEAAMVQARIKAKEHFLHEHVITELLDRDPSAALRIEQRNLTPRQEATIGQHMIRIIRAELPAGIESEATIKSAIMPLMTQASRFVAREYFMEYQAVIGQGDPGYERPSHISDEEFSEMEVRVAQIEALSGRDKASMIFELMMDRDDMDESLRDMFKNSLKVERVMIDPSGGDRFPSLARVLGVEDADDLTEAKVDALMNLFRGRFHNELVANVFAMRKRRESSTEPDETVAQRISRHMAIGLGPYEVHLTDMFDYSAVGFVGGGLGEKVIGSLDTSEELVKLHDAFIGEEGVLADIVFRTEGSITESNVDGIAEKIAKPIVEIAEALSADVGGQQIIDKERLAAMAVMALRSDRSGLSFDFSPEQTIWTTQSVDTVDRRTTTLDMNTRYLLYRALLIKLSIPEAKFSRKLDSSGTSEAAQTVVEAQRRYDLLKQVPIVGQMVPDLRYTALLPTGDLIIHPMHVQAGMDDLGMGKMHKKLETKRKRDAMVRSITQGIGKSDD